MANFGKKAQLECQKSTVKVECIVSVYDTMYDEDGVTPLRYKIVVQRLQDQVAESDARSGLADALPYITNKKQWYYDEEGNAHAMYTHFDYVLPDMMAAIVDAAKNCYESTVSVENIDGTKEDKIIKNYCVKLDIGFNLAKREAFFYRIKSGVNKDSLAKDIKYNLRHMPTTGRELTAKIIEDHKNITDISYQVFMASQELGGKKSGKKSIEKTEE